MHHNNKRLLDLALLNEIQIILADEQTLGSIAHFYLLLLFHFICNENH